MPNPSSRLPRVRASELVGRGWLNTGGTLVTLADLRGKVVVLDFWTFCCINCLHVLDELRELEEAHRDELVIVGVHSPKFAHEADPAALAAAVERYDVRHPVLDDAELVTWSAYTARAWPTLVVVDPEGYVVAQMAGEGHASALEALVDELVAEHDAKGTLHRGSGPYVPPAPASGTLRFPGKVLGLPGGTLLVADAGHHSLAELAPDGESLVRRIGSGERGLVDGGPGEARFSEPNGLCLVPAELRGPLGYDVLVADTVNHALRGVRLADGAVTTVAGTGEPFMVGARDNLLDAAGRSVDRPFDLDDAAPARSVRLSSPWDVLWSETMGAFVVAAAGTHTLWAFGRGTIAHLGGTLNEGLLDGPLPQAWFAQPSGLAEGPDGRLWIADAETSALRVVDPAPDASVGMADAVVRTAVGQGLFDFGHRDGDAGQALLQHPLGVAALPDGSVVLADTYNGALRRYAPGSPDLSDPEAGGDDPGSDNRGGSGGGSGSGEVTTLATGLAEPSDVVVLVDGRPWSPADGAPSPGARLDLLVVESAAHRLIRVAVPARLAGQVLDGGAHRTRRPVTDVGAGPLRLEVPFAPAPGQRLDDRYGPSTHLSVTATPPGLLLAGAGEGTDLFRDLVVDPGVEGGVLHVSVRAASCDVVPEGADDVFPACHLAQQDWGVPVRVVRRDDGDRPGPPATLTLPLRG
ncbi:NHL domain-containing thioredoxin family protein [Cellulomonas sp. PhB143]|uniref:NHL domain-containing thioredoxin family protein n=1 Tax=Cellulomonas sp. PhB143 TaxID=2485186 RepID=UPI000F485CF2|nr:NHL domain-containing thioredoxin family protein [Cellulomonas sp. PhB143]ROS79053.1 thiol-disulfide isomerase/thioredoxin [Cellulomonas sp. PhB143]